MSKELKEKILAANAAYRSGSPIMEDGEFDALLEELQSQISEEEYNSFRNTLHEVKGKVKHPYVLGSLDKLKSEEPEKVAKFISENLKTKLNVSAKVDGISCRLHYENGMLKSASTRGNGTFGEDLTDKIKHVKNVPAEISVKDVIDVRGELVILKDEFTEFSSEFANPRNAVAGFMNRKDWKAEDIEHVSFIAYTVLGTKYQKSKQFDLLEKNGFVTAWHKDVVKAEAMKDGFVEKLTKLAEQEHSYETDGLVLCDASYLNEDKYRPDTCVAFKTNQQIGVTTLLDVAFDGPSKDGTHSPVAILEPIDLGGAMIGRASVYNLDAIKKLGLKCGCKVKLLRSGDVIPKIIEVIETPKSCTDIVLPTKCNCCGSELVRDGVNLRCKNDNCSAQMLWRITKFIKDLGVKSISDKTLANYGIYSVEDLLKFKVTDSKSKTQQKFAEELKLKIFSRTKDELLCAMNFSGLGMSSIQKIIDFYGWEAIEAKKFDGHPDGIGDLLLEKFISSIDKNMADLKLLLSDVRYAAPVESKKAETKSNGRSVCFTGKLNTMGRTEAEKKAIAAGFEVKSVNKKLTYLVTNDPDTNSGKGKKARELGIKIISEADFLKMLTDSAVEQDIGDL